MNEQQLQELFKQFLIEKTGAKDEKELNQYLQKMDKSQIEQLKEEFVQILQQQQAQKARHGAKLNYVKQLKHQCAEDEKLVYFKKGGSIGCGCVKKDNGGQIKKSAIDNFKSRRKKYETDMRKAKDEAERDSIAVNKYNDQDVQTSKPGKYINGVWTPDRTKWPYNKKAKKEEKGGKTPKAGTGCMLKSKFVKKGSKIKVGCHQQGGSLNGIPFMQQGKNLPTAPKVEDRYKNSKRHQTSYKYKGVTSDSTNIKQVISEKPTLFGNPAVIRQVVNYGRYPYNNDTTYIEIPEISNPFTKRKIRATNKHIGVLKDYYSHVIPYFGQLLPDSLGTSNKKEYEILKRRFNTAWNLAK